VLHAADGDDVSFSGGIGDDTLADVTFSEGDTTDNT
jgi:hypothetical protein